MAATPAQAYALAGDLAALIDDMIIEGAPWTKLETLAPDLYDSYWRITLDFLKIAFAHWPEWLAGRGLIDRAKRVALLIENEIKAVESGAGRGPTIIAGSTGANRATARLIAAIARSAQGAVVLPDLDLNLDDRAWAMISASEESQGLAGHPQALLHRLVGVIGVGREDVKTLGSPSLPLASRSAFVSEALRPRRNRPIAGAIASARCRRPRSPPRLRGRYDRRRRQRERRGLGAGDRHARNARNAGQDRSPHHARSDHRAPRIRGACAMGRRGRGFRPGACWGKAPRARSPG